ncbi:MAG TPA: serine/threonine-protein kinase [Bryobacteraceae bacterium]
MNRERWPEVKQILEQALEIPEAEREAFLPGACGGDAGLRQEVEQYLRYSGSAQVLLPADGLTEIAFQEETAHPLPERLGPYRVIREIGRGGMGVVYLAERDDGEFQRAVAIKLIQSGVREEEFAKLFRRERQILAQLEHPNIARLFEGGTTAAGQPYFAMEFVEGLPLEEYCALNALTLRQKLELFLSVCSAVAYAHRKLIIHRDLKPQNVLIGADGIPKLLDFGLAKILEDGSPSSEHTMGTLLLTPSHASPEQVKGEPLTVATDVYSLGVLLYELLTARHPYGPCAGPIGAAIAVLEAPPKPMRGTGVRVPADLENIVFCALRKEPERRYVTVDAFSEDIRRFLRGYPVRAAGDSLGYRVHKFARRHRWALGAAAAVIVALAISGAMTWRAKQEAELRFLQIRGLAHSVVFEIHDAIAGLPGSTPAERLLVARALHYLNALAKDRGNDPGLMFELAKSYEKVGDAQGHPGRPNLGDRRGALASYTKARQLLLELRRNPTRTDVESWLANVDEDLADVLPEDQPTPILARRAEAVALFQDVAHKSSGLSGLYDLARAQYDLALAKSEQRRYRDAIAAWHAALTSFARIAKAESNSDKAQENLTLVEKRLAGTYYALDDCTNSMIYDKKAAVLDASRMAADADNQAAQTDLSLDLIEVGECQDRLGRRKQALQTLDRTVALRRRIAVNNPRDSRAQSSLEDALRVNAGIRLNAGDLGAAWRLARQALKIGTFLHTEHPHDPDQIFRLALDHRGIGLVYRARSDWQHALDEFQTARKLALNLSPRAFADPHDLQSAKQLPILIAGCRRHIHPSAP